MFGAQYFKGFSLYMNYVEKLRKVGKCNVPRNNIGKRVRGDWF